MPGRAACLERGAAVTAPVGLEKARRRQILGGEDGVLGAIAAPRGRARRQRLEHPVAQIGEIAGARREGLVVAFGVLDNLALEHVGPGAIRRRARGDALEDRTGQVIVLEQRDLEFEDRRRHRLGARGERLELGSRLDHCRLERGALFGRHAGHASHGRSGLAQRDGPDRQAVRRRNALDHGLATALTHRSSARPARPARARHRPHPDLPPRSRRSRRGAP